MKHLLFSASFILLSATSSAAQSVNAYVFDPPSNVRVTPNGAIQCSVNSRIYINIYGTSSDGAWFKTDYCGSMGYIHNSQITQPQVQSTPAPYTSGYCILRGQVVPDYNCY